MNYSVAVAYNDRVYETVHVEAETDKEAEFEARNIVMDTNVGAYDVDIVEVRAIG